MEYNNVMGIQDLIYRQKNSLCFVQSKEESL